MEFKQYWQELLKINPIQDGQKVTMSKAQFMKMQKQAFDYGYHSNSFTQKIKKFLTKFNSVI